MRFQSFTAVAVVLITSGFAQISPDPSFSRDKGRLSPEGTFQTKNADVGNAPDPEARLEEPVIPIDVEVLKTGTVEVDQRSQTMSTPFAESAEDYMATTKDRPQEESGGSFSTSPWNAVTPTVDGPGFTAPPERPLVAFITEGSTQVHNPRPGRTDEIMRVRDKPSLPAMSRPVPIVIHKSPNQTQPKNP